MRAPTPEELAAMPKPTKAIKVVGGFVWEYDINEDGLATSRLRPHYKETDPGFPNGGYPAVEDLPRIQAEASARGIAERKATLEKALAMPDAKKK